MLDLAVILERCHRGDALAWEALVRQFQSRIYALAFYYLRDQEEARDLAQEIFVRIYKSLSNCAGADSFVPWMLVLARNCCIDRLRRTKIDRVTTNFGEEPYDLYDEQPDPEEKFQTNARKRLLYRALDTLNHQSREMILLKEIQGLKFREIAHMLSLPLGTVKSRSSRARADLAEAVTDLEPSYGFKR